MTLHMGFRGVVNDPFAADVVYLAHCDGANGSTTIVDSSKTGLAVPINAIATISTAAAKFGASSLNMTGVANCFAQSAVDAALALPADFTMECFVNIRGTVGGGDWCIFDLRSASATTAPCIVHQSGYVIGGMVNGTVRWVDTVNSQNVWKHVAITRDGSTCRQFVDGVKIGSDYTFATAIGNGRITLGKYYNGNNGDNQLKLNGYLDEIRVTKACRYRSNFSPPTKPFNP